MEFLDYQASYEKRTELTGAEKIRQWFEKGLDTEWVVEYFLRFPLIDVRDVVSIVAQKVGTRVDDLTNEANWDPSIWVFLLKDRSFHLVESALDLDSCEEDMYTTRIFERARGNSLEECLEKAFGGEKSDIYWGLLREGCSKGLQL